MAWTVHVIDRATLDDLGTLETATVSSYGFRRNGIGEASVAWHVTDPVAVEHLRCGTTDTNLRELAIYEDATLRWQGVPGPWEVDLQRQAVTMRCFTLERYFDGKVFGRADRINRVENGGFEDATITPWVEEDPDTVLTVSIDTTFANEGDQSLKLVGTGYTGFVTQELTDTVDHSYPDGLILSMAGWVYVDSAATVPEGTVLAQLIGYAAVPGSPYVAEYTTDSTFQLGAWQRIQVDLLISAFTDWTVETRLYGVDGTLWWDSVQAVYPDSTGAVVGADLADLVTAMAEYGQDPSVGQSGESIGTNCPPTGITLVAARGFAHTDHEGIWDGFVQVAEENAVDIWVDLNRDLCLDVKRGTDRSDLATTVTLEDPSSLLAGPQSISGDPSQGYSSIIVIGEGSNFAREEVGAVDTTNFGGLVRTKVIRAPVSATVRAMGELAETTLLAARNVAAFPKLSYHFDDLDDAPEPGDVIPVTIDFGCAQFDDDLRVEAVEVHPLSGAVEVSLDRDWDTAS